MQSIINGFRKYNINSKTGLTEDYLAFYPESYINTGENYSSIKEEEIICDFIIKEKLGEGAFGSVRLGINKQTGEKVAIKILDKNKLTKYEDKQRIEKEIEILKKLRHPNIVRLYSIIETEKQILLITEYIKGQELFQYILLKKKLSEEEACFYFSQIVSGIEYLHKLKIAHRDIKSENIIIEQNTKLIKILDFGLSNTYGDKDEEILSSSCGSPLYAAPEMLKGDIYKGSTVDIWSMGIVLYSMICGSLPFQDEDNTKLYNKIIQGKYTIPMHVSTNARELLHKLIEINPRKRINISQIKRHPWIKLYCPQYINKNGRVFDIGFNLDKYVIPIDEEIIDELNIKYNLPKVKLRINILMNKSNDYTTLYEILLNKKIREGKKSVADLKSDLYFNYIRNKNNLLKNYKNDIKKIINERKEGYKLDDGTGDYNSLNKNKIMVKSQEEIYKKNDIYNMDIKSFKYDSNINLKSDLNNNYTNRNNNILNFQFDSINDSENNLKLNTSKEIKSINYIPSHKTKNTNKFHIINNKRNKQRDNIIRNNITENFKRKKKNSSLSDLITDQNDKYYINEKNNKKRLKKNESVDITNAEKSKINQLLNNKPDFINKDNKHIFDNQMNNFKKISKENQINYEHFKENIKTLLKENQKENNEKTKEIISKTISDGKVEQNLIDILQQKSDEQTKNEINENSQSNNYLTTDEKIKNAQTLDSFSLKNYIDDNLFNNFSIQNVNMISFYPKEQRITKNKHFHKTQYKKKANKQRISLKKHDLQININDNKYKKVLSTNKNKIPHRNAQSALKRKYLENIKTGITPINKTLRLKEIMNLKTIDSENFRKIKNESMINITKKNFKIKKYNSIDNEFKQIKNLNLNLKKVFSINKGKYFNHSLSKNKKRNNKIFSSVTELNQGSTPIKYLTKRKNRIFSNHKHKIFKHKEINDDVIIHRNQRFKKSRSLFLDEQTHNTFSNNNNLDLSNIEKKAMNLNKAFNKTRESKIVKTENITNEKNYEENYKPFDLSCVFLLPRKQLKQKIVGVCKKMKYKIKFLNLYKCNIHIKDKEGITFEINFPKNKLGIINIRKYRINDTEQRAHINKIISAIKK